MIILRASGMKTEDMNKKRIFTKYDVSQSSTQPIQEPEAVCAPAVALSECLRRGKFKYRNGMKGEQSVFEMYKRGHIQSGKWIPHQLVVFAKLLSIIPR